ncbi:phosphonate C-P lyase system protein PhnL [Gracilibacillus kekensis]|uniref:Alpha-D-ribose 1-methylphosphonate 5-triphosphate synthase subunit PhnL n=1 Tax=Gracilibacillus kekensis TaxID=1027249 RepID=A0A1M7QPL5_9BACI|nr:phosphonate C-P lyase system protein PhnL [Gracilibacillus kekensis]SHN33500.1 alpha-D-ribose 1-methylphosphonate 5-triphosphate synthase subunit PhnL [Gracilibacillus kekensis]
MTMLEIKGFGKSFTIHHLHKTIPAVSPIDLKVEAGEFVGIVGKSGSGKSTILKSIYRTYLPYTGEINYSSAHFGTIDLSKATERQMLYLRKNEIGYVSQFLNVMPRTSCRQLVQNALLEMGEPKESAKHQAEEALQHFEMDPALWDSYPKTFSGGEKLRLNIAMATVKKPKLLLLDEPTASLDHHSKIKVREMIEKLKRQGTTLVGIFHDIEFMEGLCDKVFDMKDGQLASSLEGVVNEG